MSLANEEVYKVLDGAHLAQNGDPIRKRAALLSAGLGALVAAATWCVSGHMQRKTFQHTTIVVDH